MRPGIETRRLTRVPARPGIEPERPDFMPGRAGAEGRKVATQVGRSAAKVARSGVEVRRTARKGSRLLHQPRRPGIGRRRVGIEGSPAGAVRQWLGALAKVPIDDTKPADRRFERFVCIYLWGKRTRFFLSLRLMRPLLSKCPSLRSRRAGCSPTARAISCAPLPVAVVTPSFTLVTPSFTLVISSASLVTPCGPLVPRWGQERTSVSDCQVRA